MRIKVHNFYQDVKGRKAQAGEQDSNDLPNGLAQYLVDNGLAVIIEADEQPPPPVEIETVEPDKPSTTRRRNRK